MSCAVKLAYTLDLLPVDRAVDSYYYALAERRSFRRWKSIRHRISFQSEICLFSIADFLILKFYGWFTMKHEGFFFSEDRFLSANPFDDDEFDDDGFDDDFDDDDFDDDFDDDDFDDEDFDDDGFDDNYDDDGFDYDDEE